ncbi:MAG: hypothetical protein E6Q97_27955 [Desulfurellales bacterium]|nr:MAG: hypothetical protein E6Q97_27955 [Desulfurellales bacterium]
MSEVFERAKRIKPEWWSAIAGAAGAGALVAPGHRVWGALLLGGAVAALAYSQTACCESCAHGGTCAGEADALASAADHAAAAESDVAAVAKLFTAGGCASCA